MSRYVLMRLKDRGGRIWIAALLTLIACSKGNSVDPGSATRHLIVFTMLDTSSHRSFIYRMNDDGSEIKQLTFPSEILDTVQGMPRTRGSTSEPRWSSNGKRIVYSESLGPDESHIVAMHDDGSNKKVFTPVGGYCVRPRWSPEGDRILYFRGTYMGVIIATSIVDTTGHSFDVQIAPESRMFEGDSVFYDLTQIQWSTDGGHLCVWGSIGRRFGDPLYGISGEIFLLDIASGKVLRRLTHNRVDERGFELSPDLSHLIFVQGPYQIAAEIYVMSLADSVARPLSKGKNDSWPRWSNDGRMVVYLKDENDDPYAVSNRIYVVDLQTLKEQRISSVIADQPHIH